MFHVMSFAVGDLICADSRNEFGISQLAKIKNSVGKLHWPIGPWRSFQAGPVCLCIYIYMKVTTLVQLMIRYVLPASDMSN